MRRFFSGDFHLGFSGLMAIEKWPFKSIEKHDEALIRSCKQRAKSDDIIYHLGDLASYKQDNHGGLNSKGLDVKPNDLLKDISATFINIRGNHDLSNRVKSICDSMHIYLSKRYPSVSLSHYPTYDSRIDPSCLTAPIHFSAHVHGRWLHCLDLDHRILNVNVGCMVWGFKIISDVELIDYLNDLFKKKPDELFRCKKQLNGKIAFFK